MSDTREEREHEDGKWFDLLVDGELDEQRRNELLSRLDHQPGGWRRCAMAFLEAQTWRQELGDWVTDAKTQAPPVPASVTESRSRSLGPGSWLVVAASFIAAFGLGLFLRDIGRPRGLDAPGLVADDSQRPPMLEDSLAQHESGSPSLPGGGVMTMSFRPGPEGHVEEVQVPFIDAQDASPDWLAGSPAAMPAEVLRDLQRSGHQVEQSRHLVPFDLHDGRQVVVPVDRVNVHYVGNRSYQ